MSLQERIDLWVSRALVRLMRNLMQRLMRKLIGGSLGIAGPASRPDPVQTRSAIPLHRDPWCGTHVSPEVSIPLEQAGQMLHFCSAECRARYQRSSQRAASA